MRMKKTFDFVEKLISPVAKGPIHPIDQRDVPVMKETLYEQVTSQVQGWNLDPISGTFSDLSPDQYNPNAIQSWVFGKAGMFPEFGQVPKILNIPVWKPKNRTIRPDPEISGIGCGPKKFYSVYITSPECRVNPTGIYQGYQVNGNN